MADATEGEPTERYERRTNHEGTAIRENKSQGGLILFSFLLLFKINKTKLSNKYNFRVILHPKHCAFDHTKLGPREDLEKADYYQKQKGNEIVK